MSSPRLTRSDISAVDYDASNQKLKESCDDCAISKVKCTREKPTCQRCARRQRPCVYGASRRNGRTGQRVGTRQTSVAPSPVTSDNNAQRGHHSATKFSFDFVATGNVTDSCPSQVPSSNSIASSISNPSWFDYDFPDNFDFSDMEYLKSPDNMDDSLTADGPVLHHIYPIANEAQETIEPHELHSDVMPTSIHQIAPVAQMLPSRFEDQRAEHTDSDANHASTTDVCLSTATNLLLSLFPNTNTANISCVDIDAILKRNRRAIDDATSILSCDCTKDRYLIHILGLGLLKVMAWYAALIENKQSPADETPRIYNKPSKRRQDSVVGRDMVPELPSESRHEGRQAAQAVMGELHHLQRLLKLFCKHFSGGPGEKEDVNTADGCGQCSLGRTHRGSDTIRCASTEGSSDRFHSELHEKFRAVSSAAIRVLRIT